MKKGIVLIVGLFLLVLTSSAAAVPPDTPVGQEGLTAFCADGGQIVIHPLGTDRVFVECEATTPDPTAVPTDEPTPDPTEEPEPTEPAPTPTAVGTPASTPEPPPSGGDYGVWPNCENGAIAVENHGWWKTGASSEAELGPRGAAPYHFHVAACVPMARPDGSVIASEPYDLVVRVLCFNGCGGAASSEVEWLRYSWQGDVQQVERMSMSCGNEGEFQECVEWITLTVDPSQQGPGVDEMRLTPNIDPTETGGRFYLTLNYQNDNGGDGRYRRYYHASQQAWYTGDSYIQASWLNVHDYLSSGSSMPTLSGNAEIEWRASENSCDDGAVYLLGNGRDGFHGFHRGDNPKPVAMDSASSCGDHSFVMDTTQYQNGIYQLYNQSCGARGSGDAAGLLCVASSIHVLIDN